MTTWGQSTVGTHPVLSISNILLHPPPTHPLTPSTLTPSPLTHPHRCSTRFWTLAWLSPQLWWYGKDWWWSLAARALLSLCSGREEERGERRRRRRKGGGEDWWFYSSPLLCSVLTANRCYFFLNSEFNFHALDIPFRVSIQCYVTLIPTNLPTMVQNMSTWPDLETN